MWHGREAVKGGRADCVPKFMLFVTLRRAEGGNDSVTNSLAEGNWFV
jgi:hypothetical protein